jgi:hypothetical protein
MGNAQAEGSTHRVDDIPFVLVGRAGGALRAGRVVRPGSWQGAPASVGSPRGVTAAQLAGGTVTVSPSLAGADRGSTSNNELLASISTLMDIPSTSFGTGYPGTLNALL